MALKLGLLKTVCLILIWGVSGCAYMTPDERRLHAQQIVKQAGWVGESIETSPFDLQVFKPATLVSASHLTIYIEGDGLAWISRTQPSQNPTPQRPIGLELALADSSDSVVYLARPCQYLSNFHCQISVWTSARFSQQVIHSMNHAIDQLKQQHKTDHLTLVGFSGGGTIAALIAAQRSDVVKLITVASPLDHRHWTELMGISDLEDSLNPVDVVDKLIHVPQVHWVGEKDRVVPKAVADQFISRFPANAKPKLILVPEYDHSCCWPESWASNLEQVRP